MTDPQDVTPRVDLIARIVCIALGVFLGALSATAYFSDSHAAVYWLCGFGGIIFLAAGTVGPQSLRVGLLTWLPWV